MCHVSRVSCHVSRTPGINQSQTRWKTENTQQTLEVVSLYGPDHDPGQPPVPGQVRLELDRLLVVEADPLVALDHVGGAVAGLPPLLPPAPAQLRADLVVSQEASLASEGAWSTNMS